jgi:hypothetical protein
MVRLLAQVGAKGWSLVDCQATDDGHPSLLQCRDDHYIRPTTIKLNRAVAS